MRIQAIRASETLYKAGDRSFAADYKRLTKDPSVDVVIQALLTMNRWKVPDAAATIKATMESNQARGVQLVATTMLNPPAAARRRRRPRRALDAGAAGADRARRTDLQRAVLRLPRRRTAWARRSRSWRRRWRRRWPDRRASTATATTSSRPCCTASTGPVDGKTYTDVMIPMGDNDDEWIAAVASYVRTQLRQHRRVRHAGRRRARARRDRRPQDAVDACRS